MRQFFAALILFLLVTFSFADVTISKNNHMQNKSPGRCAWAALETLGRTHGWKSLEGCVERHAKSATREDLVAELRRYKVKYRVQWPHQEEISYYVMHQDMKSKKTSVYAVRSKIHAEYIVKTVKLPGRWWAEPRRHWDTSLIHKALADGLGAAVSVDGDTPDDRHMMVISAWGDDKITFVDSNYSPGKLRTETAAWFLRRFNGFAVVIEKR